MRNYFKDKYGAIVHLDYTDSIKNVLKRMGNGKKN